MSALLAAVAFLLIPLAAAVACVLIAVVVLLCVALLGREGT